MISQELLILTVTAVSIGFFHTLLGPDHYLPFIVMARARKWSLFKTGWITFLCGFGHIMSSVLLGMLGVVIVSTMGVNFLPMKKLERYTHAIAGATICICGLAIQFLGV